MSKAPLDSSVLECLEYTSESLTIYGMKLINNLRMSLPGCENSSIWKVRDLFLIFDLNYRACRTFCAVIIKQLFATWITHGSTGCVGRSSRPTLYSDNSQSQVPPLQDRPHPPMRDLPPTLPCHDAQASGPPSHPHFPSGLQISQSRYCIVPGGHFTHSSPMQKSGHGFTRSSFTSRFCIVPGGHFTHSSPMQKSGHGFTRSSLTSRFSATSGGQWLQRPLIQMGIHGPARSAVDVESGQW